MRHTANRARVQPSVSQSKHGAQQGAVQGSEQEARRWAQVGTGRARGPTCDTARKIIIWMGISHSVRVICVLVWGGGVGDMGTHQLPGRPETRASQQPSDGNCRLTSDASSGRCRPAASALSGWGGTAGVPPRKKVQREADSSWSCQTSDSACRPVQGTAVDLQHK